MLKNIKASISLLSIWWFFVLVIIAVGIVSGVVIFYGEKIDVRSMEAEILANRIGDCIIQNGEVKLDLFEKTADIFKFCSLNEKMLNESGKYYIHITANKTAEEISLVYGNSGFEKDCPIAAAMKEAQNYPRCSKKSFLGFNDKMELVTIKVNTGSNYQGGKGDEKQ